MKQALYFQSLTSSSIPREFFERYGEISFKRFPQFIERSSCKFCRILPYKCETKVK